MDDKLRKQIEKDIKANKTPKRPIFVSETNYNLNLKNLEGH